MEKFGVLQEEKSLTKTAEQTKPRCPTCNNLLLDPSNTGGILLCPTCGSKPFESGALK